MQPSASLLKKVLAWRGGPVPAPTYDLKKTVSRLQQVRALDARKAYFAAPKVELEVEHQALLAARAAGPIERIDVFVPQVEAAVLCLLGGNDRSWDRAHEIGADMVHLWCSRGGVVAATEALLLNMELQEDGQRRREVNGFFPYIGPWKALRGQLAGASQQEYEQSLALARSLSWGQVAWLAAFAFASDQEFVAQAIEDALGAPAGVRSLGLLASAHSGEQFARLCGHLKHYLGVEEWTGIKLSDYAPSSIVRLGNESFEGLRVLAEAAEKVGHKRLLGEYLAELTHPEVGPWLQARLKDKAFGPIAHAYASRQVAAAPQASEPAAEQPALLSSPPWENRMAKVKPQVVTLSLPALPERVHFPPGREAFIRDNSKLRNGAKWRKLWEELPNDSFFPDELCELEDREWALQIWNQSPARRWNPYTLRNNYYITVPERILARFGAEAIPGLLTCLSSAPDVIYAGLSLVESARLAPIFAEAWVTKKKFRKLAGAWFTKYPRAAALGLLPVALGPTGKAREYAESALRWLAGKGHAELLRQLAPGPALEQVLSYDPLQQLPAKMPGLPAWFRADLAEPPLTLKGDPLSLSCVHNLALMAVISTPDQPYPGLSQTGCQKASLTAFAWSVYEQWLKAGGPAQDLWAFYMLAYWGDDEVARKLAPQVRRWPGEGLSVRAGVGLDILRYLGSDVALMQLHGIALKVRFKALQDKAQAHIQEIAEERGLSLEELGDRLVPNLDNEILLPYRVTFDEQLCPHAEIPKSAPKEVQEAWKALKKDAKSLATLQLQRLEQALTGQRRWSVEDFRSLLVDHPLLIHLVRRFIWGVYRQDQVELCFRVAEDRTFADVDDHQVDISGTIGLVHPLEAPLVGWGQILSDYKILQPFPQVDRSTHLLPEGFTGQELSLYQGMRLSAGHLLSLEARGWRRGEVESGCLLELQRGPFRLELEEGLALEDIATSEVSLGALRADQDFSSLPKVQVSEALRDLEDLRSRAL